ALNNGKSMTASVPGRVATGRTGCPCAACAPDDAGAGLQRRSWPTLDQYLCSGEGWSEVWSTLLSMDVPAVPGDSRDRGCRRQMLYYRTSLTGPLRQHPYCSVIG